MSFKVGEKVVCIGSYDWANGGGRKDKVPGPKKWEVLKIDFIKQYTWGIGLGFKKYSKVEGFDSDCFRKLSDVSAELSEEILEKIKVTEEEPITV